MQDIAEIDEVFVSDRVAIVTWPMHGLNGEIEQHSSAHAAVSLGHEHNVGTGR